MWQSLSAASEEVYYEPITQISDLLIVWLFSRIGSRFHISFAALSLITSGEMVALSRHCFLYTDVRQIIAVERKNVTIVISRIWGGLLWTCWSHNTNQFRRLVVHLSFLRNQGPLSHIIRSHLSCNFTGNDRPLISNVIVFSTRVQKAETTKNL